MDTNLNYSRQNKVAYLAKALTILNIGLPILSEVVSSNLRSNLKRSKVIINQIYSNKYNDFSTIFQILWGISIRDLCSWILAPDPQLFPHSSIVNIHLIWTWTGVCQILNLLLFFFQFCCFLMSTRSFRVSQWSVN